MKALNWIKENKYPLMVAGFFLMVLIVFLLIFQALRKDHSLDLVKQELKLKEESNRQQQQLRAQFTDEIKTKDEYILIQKIQDSILQARGLVIDHKIDQLPKKYNEKTKIIDSYSDNDLLNYFNNLSEPNDY